MLRSGQSANRRGETVERGCAATAAPALALIGAVLQLDKWDTFWVLRSREGLIDAAGLSRRWIGGDHYGPKLAVRALDEHRFRESVLAFTPGAESRAADLGAMAVHAASDGATEVERAAWSQAGFDRAIRIQGWSMSVHDVIRSLSPTLRRLKARGRLAESEILPFRRLTEPQRQQAIELQANELGGHRHDLDLSLRMEGSTAFDQSLSMVALDAQANVVGVALTGNPGGGEAATLDGVVVSPRLRRTSIVASLKLAVAEAFADRGGDQFRFSTLDHHTDSVRSAARMGARRTSVEERRYLLLNDRRHQLLRSSDAS
ncbi:MAG: hypothetical protein AAFZ67_08880 [Planctomycetota bacterium]